MNTRPYFIKFNGEERMIEATSQPAAIAHASKALVELIYAASGKKLSEFVRNGGKLEVAGEEPEPAIPFKTGEAIEGEITPVDGEVGGDGTGTALEPVE